MAAIDSRVLEEATGTGGNVYISSNSLQLDNGAWIDTSTYGGGHSGSIDIQASNIVLGNDTPGSGPGTTMSPTFFGAIESTSKGTGTGGNVTINADSLTLQNGFRISTSGWLLVTQAIFQSALIACSASTGGFSPLTLLVQEKVELLMLPRRISSSPVPIVCWCLVLPMVQALRLKWTALQ